MHPETQKLLKRLQAERDERAFAESFEKGEAIGIAKTIISVLEARGLTVTESQRQRVLDCTDVTQLNRWVDRSVTITDVAALFDA
jgi:hypothetical protein